MGVAKAQSNFCSGKKDQFAMRDMIKGADVQPASFAVTNETTVYFVGGWFVSTVPPGSLSIYEAINARQV